MTRNWPYIVLTAGSLLLGIAHGASATTNWARHGDSRHHHSDWRAEQHRELIHAQRERAAAFRRERERQRRLAHRQRSQHAFDYIGAADRARHRR
jgi:hypothetical protein